MTLQTRDLLDRPPLGEDLARRLAAEIIRFRPGPGTRLVETEICARHGVSRSPLRDALRLLEHWSLVERRPRYGVRVAPMSVTHLGDLSVCRIPLEGRAAALVAGLPGRGAILTDLERSLERMRAAAGAGDGDACFDANLAMMETLHRANPNPMLARLLGELNLPAQRYRYLVYRYASDTLGMLIDGNAQLLDAIATGDARQALETTEAMVRDASLQLAQRLPDYLDRAASEART